MQARHKIIGIAAVAATRGAHENVISVRDARTARETIDDALNDGTDDGDSGGAHAKQGMALAKRL
jgi:hypothetical protein